MLEGWDVAVHGSLALLVKTEQSQNDSLGTADIKWGRINNGPAPVGKLNSDISN